MIEDDTRYLLSVFRSGEWTEGRMSGDEMREISERFTDDPPTVAIARDLRSASGRSYIYDGGHWNAPDVPWSESEEVH
jgi:hypothetical protein